MADDPRETEEMLEAYASLIRKWNPRINLVAPSTLPNLEKRHFSDCLQLRQLVEPEGLWADLGSGGGLPGLILAIAWNDTATNFVLVESDQRKVAFLRTVIRELALPNVSVLDQRIENLSPLQADHLSARALAPLPKLMPYIQRHLRPGGTAWLMKGRTWMDELAETELTWRFAKAVHPSRTDSDSAILELTDISLG